MVLLIQLRLNLIVLNQVLKLQHVYRDHQPRNQLVTMIGQTNLMRIRKDRSQKLRKNMPVDQQIVALNKEEMEIKREMLKKMELQDQQFSCSMEALQENMSNLTNILSQSIQMMTASFNPNLFQYRQVNHYQELYHQQTGSNTQSIADIGKVNPLSRSILPAQTKR